MCHHTIVTTIQYKTLIHCENMELLKNLVILALFAFFLSRVIESSLKLHDPKIAVSLKRTRQVAETYMCTVMIFMCFVKVHVLSINHSTKLVRFPSIAICVDNLWYINVTHSGKIVVNAEAYNETQFFREVKLSFFNETR